MIQRIQSIWLLLAGAGSLATLKLSFYSGNKDNNLFEECWALSYDYGYDGGAIELFGKEMNGNEFMYNTAVNCNGFLEVGSNVAGKSSNNIVAYNKIINCGIIGYYHNTSAYKVTVYNMQYYNNTVIETTQQFTKPAYLFAMQGDGQKGMLVIKNNIFWLTSGVKFASIQFTNGQMLHEHNVFNLTNQHHGFRFNNSEKNITRQKIFKSSAGEPRNWDLHLMPGSMPIDFGLQVGLNRDFNGHALLGRPDAGAYEFVK